MTPEEQIDGFIDKYSPAVAALAREALARMRARLPGALELVYDNYNALAVAFARSERPADIMFSIALYPRWVSLFFVEGASLPDPHGALKGAGKAIRHVVLSDPAMIDAEPVRGLIEAALDRAGRPFGTGAGQIIVKSISAKQKPRRPSAFGS